MTKGGIYAAPTEGLMHRGVGAGLRSEPGTWVTHRPGTWVTRVISGAEVDRAVEGLDTYAGEIGVYPCLGGGGIHDEGAL